MGKILLNGIEYSGLSVINGMFIDTDNVITSGTITAGSSVSYTATADCAFDFLAYSSGGSNAFLQIDGKNIFTSSASTNRNTFLIKKGQVVTVGSYGTNGSYTVYGLKQGSSVSGASVNYSTTEQVVGKWIDNKPLYQKTWVVPKSSLSSGESTYTHGDDLHIDTLVDVRGTVANSRPLVEYHSSSTWACSIYNIGNNAFWIYLGSNVYSNMAATSTVKVTLQYTKTTDT